MRVLILLAALALATPVLAQTNGTVTPTATPTVAPTPTVVPPSPSPVPTPPPYIAFIQSLSISPSNPSIPSGQSVQLVATAHMNNGETTANMPVLWHTSDPVVAMIAPNGIVIGEQAGSAQITATFSNLNAVITVTVSATPTPAVSPTPTRRQVQRPAAIPMRRRP